MLEHALLGYRARRKAEIEQVTYLARLAAGLMRWPKDRRLPSLDDLLKPARKQEQQSPDQMVCALDAWVRATAQET